MLGSLAITAWGVLSAPSSPRLPPVSLALLFVGAALNIIGPTIFRAAGTEGTCMGLETAINIGYAAIVLAIASSLPNLFAWSHTYIVSILVVLALIARELLDIKQELSRATGLLKV